jgi:hypothetical protein
MELFGSNEGMEDASQSLIYWFETLAAIINRLKRPEKGRLEKWFDLWKNEKIPTEEITTTLTKILNDILKLAISDKSRATEDLTLGGFIKENYNQLLGQKIVLRAKYRPLFILEFHEIDAAGIQVVQVDRKEARKKPVIDTDLEFERRVLIGEEIDPLISMINPQEVGNFSIMRSVRYWTDILADFSKFIFVITISFLHRDYLNSDLNELIYKELLISLEKFNL